MRAAAIVLAAVWLTLLLAAWLHLARPGRGSRRLTDRLTEMRHEREAHRHYVRQLVAERDELHASWHAEYTAHAATRTQLAAARTQLAALTQAANAAADATGWAETVPAPADTLPAAQLAVLRRRPRLSGEFRVPGYIVRYQTPAPA